jgi:hypothetical protein
MNISIFKLRDNVHEIFHHETGKSLYAETYEGILKHLNTIDAKYSLNYIDYSSLYTDSMIEIMF